MGLDLCVGHPDRGINSLHYSYSGFACFRRWLARQIGIDLDKMAGFGGKRSWEGIDDPLVALLNHLDCQGKILPKACRLAASRLFEILEDLDDPEEEQNIDFAWQLAELMEECGQRRMWLHFC